MTEGVVWIHSALPALCPHIEWAVGRAFDAPVSLNWTRQSVLPNQLRAEHSWVAPPGRAAAVASALLAFKDIRFEVAETAGRGHEGERLSYTPALGLFRAATGLHGDISVPEARLHAALAAPDEARLRESIESLLGMAWDAELEPFRLAGDGCDAVRVLHRVV